MKLYYRADTRPPNRIFSEGFTPRFGMYNDEKPWWLYGLSRFIYGDTEFPTTEAILHSWQNHYYYLHEENPLFVMESNSSHVISLTSKLEAAPIFPVEPNFITGKNYDEVFIYVLALPDATLPSDFTNLKKNHDDKIDVFDLYALQRIQAQNILNRHPNVNPGFVTQGLCGYEAFVPQVKSENIICAIKCKRSDLQKQTIFQNVFTHNEQYMIPFERRFQLCHEILCNPKYNGEDLLKENAIKLLSDAIKKGEQQTTNVTDALASSELDYSENTAKKTNLFLHQIKTKQPWSALGTLARSVGNVVAKKEMSSLKQTEILIQNVMLEQELPTSNTEQVQKQLNNNNHCEANEKEGEKIYQPGEFGFVLIPSPDLKEEKISKSKPSKRTVDNKVDEKMKIYQPGEFGFFLVDYNSNIGAPSQNSQKNFTYC